MVSKKTFYSFLLLKKKCNIDGFYYIYFPSNEKLLTVDLQSRALLPKKDLFDFIQFLQINSLNVKMSNDYNFIHKYYICLCYHYSIILL